jgi:hypothetical protein
MGGSLSRQDGPLFPLALVLGAAADDESLMIGRRFNVNPPDREIKKQVTEDGNQVERLGRFKVLDGS